MRQGAAGRRGIRGHISLEGMTAGAVGLGLVLRAAWVLSAPRVVIFDAVQYEELARSLAAGHGFSTLDGPSAFWTPGWPAWMSLFYRAGLGDTAVALGSVALGGVTLALTHRLAAELHGSKSACVATGIVALLPSLVALPSLLASENLSLPFTVGTALLLVRAERSEGVSRWIGAGVSCGLSVLVREASLALVLAGAVLGLGRPRSRAPGRQVRAPSAAWSRLRVAAFLLSAAILLVPWILRNRTTLGVPVLTTSAPINLCVGLGEESTGGSRFIPWEGIEREADARALDCVRQGLRHRPWGIVTLAPAKLSRWFAWDDWEFDVFFSHALPEIAWRAFGAACDVGYWALLGLAIVAVARRRADRSLLVVLGSFLAATLVTFGNARFHVVALPLLAIVASALWRDPDAAS